MKKILFVLVFFYSCQLFAQSPMDYAEQMAHSEIKRNPEIWMADFLKKPKWDYTQGLIAKSMLMLWKETGNEEYYTYAKGLVDQFIDSNGVIATYKLRDYNIDRINPGRALFDIYHREKEPHVKTAIDTLRSQLRTQPRTKANTFWHKKIYPYQMWLDGLYMGSPFYTEYINNYGTADQYEDVIRQFRVVHQHTHNAAKNLNYHAWDESKEQAWADKNTGLSSEFWGRAMGWYAMALVDVIELLPANATKERNELTAIMNDVAKGIKKFQEPNTGLWYQVLDKGGQEGNYLEATVSCMFTYALAKGVRLNVIEKDYLDVAQKGFDGIIEYLIHTEKDSTISLTQCCAVAGLGGNPYRSGTYEYYVNEKIRDNDPKGVGPFIMAAIEIQQAQPLAFPTAEGGGKFATGGRGGVVLKVTNLNDSGPGSLRATLESKKGARTVVFEVSGTIELKSPLDIRRGNLTIAGQTAPGDGICVSGYPIEIRADNIIIRYMRFRLGDAFNVEDDAINGINCKNLIIDHCSMSWATDECATFYGNKNFTLQWCLITESLDYSVHQKGNHGYGGIWGGENASFHHNLISCHVSRNPRITHPGLDQSKYWGVADVRNNVIYNWGNNSGYGGEEGRTNLVANYYKTGPATAKKVRNRMFQISRSNTTGNYGQFFIDKNVLFGNEKISKNNLDGGVDTDTILKDVTVDQPFPFTPIREQSAEEAYKLVLDYGGANIFRDAVDTRVINDVKNGTGAFGASYGGGNKGIIDSPKDVGGYPNLNSLPAPKDSDKDGMPDEWETENGLDPKFNDANGYDLSKHYTNLEVYLNSLVKTAYTK